MKSRILVCGGRDFFDGVQLKVVLDNNRKYFDKDFCIIHGGARGADSLAGIYHLRLADGGQHAVRSPLVDHRVALAQNKKLVERHFLFAQAHVAGGRVADDIHTTSVAAPKGLTMPQSC